MRIRSLIVVSIFMTISFAPGYVQVNYNVLSLNLNNAYNTCLMRFVHQQYADREIEILKAFSSKEAMISMHIGKPIMGQLQYTQPSSMRGLTEPKYQGR